jgi:hypothetical protein
MKSMRLCATLILSALTATSIRLAAQGNPTPPPAHLAVAPDSSAPGPLILVDNPTYDFGKAPVGEKVRHTYFVTNTGTETLIISNVHPSCGCTTVGDWTHSIAPGQSGQIAVQFDTSRYGGGPPITKTIDVTSNAKNEARKMLYLKGSVWKPIELTPTVAVLNIPADATNEVTTKVRIVNQSDNPVVFSNPVSANHLFTATLKETKPGKEFELIIASQPPYTPGNTPGSITITTTLPGTPTISVPVTASVAQPVQIFPPQITLSATLDHWITNRVTIRGNTTNVLTLANPKASDSRIYVEVQPMGVAKGVYSLLVAFPPGFQVEPGKTAEVTVESNHPRFPLIKIPIKENLRPGRSAALAAHPPNPAPMPGPKATNNSALTH